MFIRILTKRTDFCAATTGTKVYCAQTDDFIVPKPGIRWHLRGKNGRGWVLSNEGIHRTP